MPKTIIPVLVDEAPRCPGCRRPLNVIHGNAIPKAGDWNICGHCAAVLRFTGEGFAQRRAMPEEIEACASAGDIGADDASFLRECFAAHAAKKGGAS